MEKTTRGLWIQHVSKSFGSKQALTDVSLHIPEGEITALLGPSGSGKSTLLYIIAGLESMSSGQLHWNGEPLSGVPTHQRGFGLMFQDFALFPHMNVYENVAFGLRLAHFPAAKIRQRVEEVLQLVGLGGFEKRDVNTLSGGEQQRVALARSLAPRPRLLMLDEPLGSLDRNLRERLVLELRQILQALHQTAIYVTHDQEEAFVLANQVAILRDGQVEQAAPPQKLYREPRSLFVARFLGLHNLLPGTLTATAKGTVVETPVGVFPVDEVEGAGMQAPGQVSVLLRPDDVHLKPDAGPATLDGRVIDSSFRGSICRVRIETNGYDLVFDFLSGTPVPETGETVHLSFDPKEALQILPEPLDDREAALDADK